MSNIGYAVFGTPKGIAIKSNGLFKESNLDSILYLDNANVKLSKTEKVILIRRIPTGSDLSNKNGLLIALYQNALQNGEDRPGGFVGSAICFKENMPNAEKMTSGLLFLFGLIKKVSLDPNNRFKDDNGDSWDLNLPDPNKPIGMFEQSNLKNIKFEDGHKATLKTYFDKATITNILQNFSLNNSFHSIEFLYASNSDTVISSMQSKGFKPIEYSRLFDYKKQFEDYSNKILQLEERIAELNKKGNQDIAANKALENKKISLENTISELEKENKTKQSSVKDIELAFQNLQGEKDKKQLELQKELDVINTQINTKKDFLDPQGNKTSLDTLFKSSKNLITEHTSFEPQRNTTNKEFIDAYLKEIPKRKQNSFKIMIGLGVVTFFMFLFLLLYILKIQSYNELEETKNTATIVTPVGEVENPINSEKLLDKVIKYQKATSHDSIQQFKVFSEKLLTTYMTNGYLETSEEVKFIKSYDWQFWEFDYTNEALAQKLDLKNMYFINLKRDIKPLKPSKWNRKTKDLLTRYLKEKNDIYQDIPKEIRIALFDNKDLEEHFDWVLDKHNKGKVTGKKLKLPYLKNKIE